MTKVVLVVSVGKYDHCRGPYTAVKVLCTGEVNCHGEDESRSPFFCFLFFSTEKKDAEEAFPVG